ncbi:MAG TPA: hypothetical protein VGR59_02860 [Gemmatimonadaceae bacterium]|nr:hypothetical protein [Gemmatimonadaceae bacterium]
MPIAIVAMAMLAGNAAGQDTAQQTDTTTCKAICKPQLLFQPGLIRTHIISGPRVQSLTTGAITRIPGQTSSLIVFTGTAKTAIPLTSIFFNVSWLPNATAHANPFTQYTASEIGAQNIRANAPAFDLGAFVSVLPKTKTDGLLTINLQVADQYSAAAQPDDQSEYTHKLDLTAIGDWSLFSKLGIPYLKNVDVLTVFDYVATGLPHKGDQVPLGERVFLDDAHSASLILQLSFPLAPLFPTQ